MEDKVVLFIGLNKDDAKVRKMLKNSKLKFEMSGCKISEKGELPMVETINWRRTIHHRGLKGMKEFISYLCAIS